MTKDSGKPISAGFGNLRKFLEDQTAAEQKGVVVSKTLPNGTKGYTMLEVAKHDTEHDCWIVVHGKVYDCSHYMEEHPGGADSILLNAGADATEDFDAIHSKKAHKLLERFYIGDVIQAEVRVAESQSKLAPSEEFALNPKKKIAFALVAKEQLSHDSYEFTFALQTPQTLLGLPTGKHIFLSAMIADDLTFDSKKR
tara:strand:- start:341 stop:931 length:591 start_codon:yes stop_codon:yes gene_type:complete